MFKKNIFTIYKSENEKKFIQVITNVLYPYIGKLIYIYIL